MPVGVKKYLKKINVFERKIFFEKKNAVG